MAKQHTISAPDLGNVKRTVKPELAKAADPATAAQQARYRDFDFKNEVVSGGSNDYGYRP